MRIPFAILLLATSLSVRAAEAPPGYPIECFEDPMSMKQFCYAPSKLTANGNLRASPLYLGTAKDIDVTQFILVADCKSSRVSAQAAKGNAAARPSINARLAKALADGMCAVKNPPIDKSLRTPPKADKVVASSHN